MNLSGQKALVTGAAGGIGKAIVKALQSAGAVVAGADQVDSDACEFSFLGDQIGRASCRERV